jgi:hypothetical protein
MDFRRAKQFRIARVEKSGRALGGNAYWQLFAVENLFRVIIHSVLSVQIAPNWWPQAVHKNIQDRARDFQQNYLKRPWHTIPGGHPIYFIYLRDLVEILRTNRRFFDPVITDLDVWLMKMEEIRLPRNVVAHMNWPGKTDQQRIRVLHSDCRALLDSLANAGIQMVVP